MPVSLTVAISQFEQAKDTVPQPIVYLIPLFMTADDDKGQKLVKKKKTEE